MKVLVVANRLPATIKITNNDVLVTQSSGGLVSALKGVKSLDAIWVGWPGCAVDAEHEALVLRECERINTVPVFLSKELVELYYNGYCNSVLWPILHYVEDTTLFDEDRMFDAYVEANHKFAHAVLEAFNKYKDEEVYIWVHDYHLMLVPEILRYLLPAVKIGFFLHTTFPHPCMWRRITRAKTLLRGILHCDLIGVHIYEYKKNLMRAARELVNCRSQLDLSCGTFGSEAGVSVGHVRVSNTDIDPSGIGVYHPCLVIALPIGIDKDHFKMSAARSDQKGSAVKFKERYRGRRIILGVDRLDYMKGIYQKLRGYQRFLTKYPEIAKTTVLIQLAVPSRGDVESYKLLKSRCHGLVAEINGHHQPVIPGGGEEDTLDPPSQKVHVEFWDKSVQFKHLLNLYMASHVCLIASVRDGMNLVASEYIATCSEREGSLCMSEFVGADRSLGVATVSFNPWNPDSLADALKESLTLSTVERLRRNQYGKSHVQTFSADRWASTFIKTLEEAPLRTGPTGLKQQNSVDTTKQSLRSFLALDAPPKSAKPSIYVVLNLHAYLQELLLPRIGCGQVQWSALDSAEVFPLFQGDTPFRAVYLCEDHDVLDDLKECGIVPTHSAAAWCPSSTEFIGTSWEGVNPSLWDSGDDSKWAAVQAMVAAKATSLCPEIKAVNMGNHVVVHKDEFEGLSTIHELVADDDDLNVMELSDTAMCIYSKTTAPSIRFIDNLAADPANRILLMGVHLYTPGENVFALHTQDRVMYLEKRANELYVNSLSDAVRVVTEVLIGESSNKFYASASFLSSTSSPKAADGQGRNT